MKKIYTGSMFLKSDKLFLECKTKCGFKTWAKMGEATGLLPQQISNMKNGSDRIPLRVLLYFVEKEIMVIDNATLKKHMQTTPVKSKRGKNVK